MVRTVVKTVVRTVVRTVGRLLRWRRRWDKRRRRARLQIASAVSHELRTPLNAILGSVELLKAGFLDHDETQRALASIERNARLETQLVDELLNASAGMRGEPPLARAGAIFRLSDPLLSSQSG
jgi:signal transduction histidine kinase